MGLFEDLGRKVGEFTHEAKRAAAEEARYACEHCGSRFYTERACPECGSEDVRELESDRADDPNERADGTAAADGEDGAADGETDG